MKRIGKLLMDGVYAMWFGGRRVESCLPARGPVQRLREVLAHGTTLYGERAAQARRDARVLSARLARLRQAFPEMGAGVGLAAEIERLAAAPLHADGHAVEGGLLDVLTAHGCSAGVSSVGRG